MLASKLASLSIPLILGSGSASRALILREAGLAFEVAKPDIDEKAIRFDDPSRLVMALGRAKAAALREGPFGARFARDRALLLTGDQVVVCGDEANKHRNDRGNHCHHTAPDKGDGVHADVGFIDVVGPMGSDH